MVDLHDAEGLLAEGVGHADPRVIDILVRERLGDREEVSRLGGGDLLRGAVVHAAVLRVGLEREVPGLGLHGRQEIDPQETRGRERREFERALFRKDQPALLVAPLDGRDDPRQPAFGGLLFETRVHLTTRPHRPEIELLALETDAHPAEEDPAVVRVRAAGPLGDGLAIDRIDDAQVRLVSLVGPGRGGDVVRRQVGRDDLAVDQHLERSLTGPQGNLRSLRGKS